MTTRGMACTTLVGCLVAACGSDDGTARRVVVRDSAGIEIVENHALPPSAPRLWSVVETPALDIGVLEGEDAYQLFGVSGVARLSDGRIVVGNGRTHEIRFFDANGRHLQTVGRRGGGPGEFEGLGRLGVAHDSIYVWDFRQRRLSVFDPSGTYIRSARVEFPGSGFPSALELRGDGSWLFTAGFAFAPSKVSVVVRDTALYAIIGADGAVVDSITRSPSVEFFVVGDERRAAASSLAFGRSTQTAVAGTTVYVAPTDRYEVFQYVDGRLARIIRRSYEPVPVTAQDVNRYKDRRLEEAEDANWRRQLERLLADMPVPATMPAFDRLKADADGNLWVMEYSWPDDAAPRWSVFDPRGRLLGQVETPQDFDVREIGRDYLLGTWEDELDVEHIRMYRLLKAGSR